MPLPRLIGALRGEPGFLELEAAIRVPAAAVHLAALPGSAGAVLVAALAEAQPSQRFVVIAPGPAEAEKWLADLSVLLEGERAALYPQREGLGDDEPHVEIAGERAETLEAMARGAVQVVVTTARATAERTLMPAALAASRLEIGKEATFRDLVQRLGQLGYERVSQVTDVAQYAVRGGIVDVYGFGMALPARAEFWGEELAALRAFDLTTQRGAGELPRVTVLPVNPQSALAESPAGADAVRCTLLDLVPAGALLVEDAPSACPPPTRAWRRCPAPPARCWSPRSPRRSPRSGSS